MNDESTVPVPFARFAAEVLAQCEPPIRRIATYRKIRQVLGEFAAICPTTADLSRSAVLQWVAAHPERRRPTVRTLLSSLRTAINLAGADYGVINPFLGRKLHAFLPSGIYHPPIRRHFPAAELAKVLVRCDYEALGGCWEARRLRVVIYLAAFTGARAREVLGLRVEDIDLAQGFVKIRPNERRGLKADEPSLRDIPIAAPLARVLASWIGRSDRRSPWLIPHQYLDGPWLNGSPRNKPLARVKALGERAGVSGLTILAFRHAFATLADRWQIGPKALQDLMGHSSPQTQWTYRHTDPDELRRAVDRVRFG